MGSTVALISVASVLLVFLAVLLLYVWTHNYLLLRRDKFNPDLLDGEKVIDRLEVLSRLVRTHTVLTNRRVLQLRLTWFLSRRKQFAIALRDVRSIDWRRQMNWVLLVLGLLFVGSLNPVALLLVLAALEGKTYSVLFNTPVHAMPWTWVATKDFGRRHLVEFTRFYRNAQVTWTRVRAENALPAPTPPVGPIPEVDTDLVWGRPVWTYVWLLLILGLVQRLVEPHLSFDDYVFAPLYLGLPVAVAHRSRRDGLWAAILGFAGLITMKFPSSALAGTLTPDGRSPLHSQYLLVLVTLVLMALVASAIAQYIHPSLAFFAVLLWLGFVGLFAPNVFFDLALYAKVAVGMAAAILLAWLERGIGRFYGVAA
jgi:hypothetical protein